MFTSLFEFVYFGAGLGKFFLQLVPLFGMQVAGGAVHLALQVLRPPSELRHGEVGESHLIFEPFYLFPVRLQGIVVLTEHAVQVAVLVRFLLSGGFQLAHLFLYALVRLLQLLVYFYQAVYLLLGGRSVESEYPFDLVFCQS